MIDPRTQTFHALSIDLIGVPATFQRLSGIDGATVILPAPDGAGVTAIVRDMQADTSAPDVADFGVRRSGVITQDIREVIVMAADLVAASFPLPVRKSDKIMLADGSTLTVIRVDPYKRAIAGAIEIQAEGTT